MQSRFIFKYLLKKKYQLENVFTPTTSAILTFIPRTDLEKDFNKNVSIPGMQIVVYGHSGSGKTTLIVNNLQRSGRKYITTRCMTGTAISDLILDAFDKLGPYYKTNHESTATKKINQGIKASYKGIEAAIQQEKTNAITEKYQRALPPQLTPQRLAEFLGETECIWVIEDFHKVLPDDKVKLSQIMKIFMDTANTYPRTKIIAIRAVDTAREVVNYDVELRNRVAEVFVPLLTDEELMQVIEKGEILLNTRFDEKLKNGIVKYANNLAAICHQLCYNVCYANDKMRTSVWEVTFEELELKNTIKEYIKQNSDSFKEILDKALKQRKGKFENVKLILKAIGDLKNKPVSYNEILKKIQEKVPDYPQGNLTTYLRPLTTSEDEEILRHDKNADKYSFSNLFFRTFVMMTLRDDDMNEETYDRLTIDINEVVTQTINLE